jgi:hypothetical protein
MTDSPERLFRSGVFKSRHPGINPALEGAMLNSTGKQQRLPEAARHEASNFTLAVVMAGVAAFFIAGIASAFIYAKDTSPRQSAEVQAAAPVASAPAETTGSGGGAK